MSLAFDSVGIRKIAISVALVAIFFVAGCSQSGDETTAPSTVELTGAGMPTPAATPYMAVPHYDPEPGEYRIFLDYIRHGMKVTITADIQGGRSLNADLNCPAIDIEWGDEAGLTVRTDCVIVDEPVIEFERRHRYDYTFEEPGDHEITFRYNHLEPVSVVVHPSENTSSTGVMNAVTASKAPDGSHVHTGGTFFRGRDGIQRLCSLMLDSLPPKCASGILVGNFPEELEKYLTTVKGVSWLDETIFLGGTINDGVLTIEH